MTRTRQPHSVAALLRRHRITAGLSQEALAERAGISVRGLSDLERGLSRVPRLETLTRIADALGLDAAGRAALVEASGHLDFSSDEVDGGLASAPALTGRAVQALPGYLTDLVGRERDEWAITRLLRERAPRLLTLTGPGGVGKTRLAVKVASGLGPVVFVPLAPVSDAALVLASIAQALGVGERSDVGLFDAVTLSLRSQRTLLLLDNFEHVLDAAPLVAEILVACPDVRMMVTSRTLLRISGEHVYAVHPLGLPEADAGEPITPELAAQSPAVALFLSRAQAVQPGFTLTQESVASVVEVCRELDGLPLALELAAARIAILPPAALLGRLKAGPGVLSSGRRDAPARHRALRDAIAWSHDLLSPDQQRLFRWLGVFAGGWTLDLAETVCTDASAQPVFESLAALVEHSLVQVQVQDGDALTSTRYRLLETVRDHAQERLAISGEGRDARARHASAMLELVEETEPQLLRPEREQSLRRLDAELDNVRAALNWSLTPDGDPELGQRIAGSLSWFWYLRGHLNEGEQWSRRLVERGVSTAFTPGSARVNASRGGTALMLGKMVEARTYLEEAVRLYRLGNDKRLPLGMTLLSIALTSVGEPRQAVELLGECAALAASIGDRWQEAYALTNQGAATLQLGNASAADELYRRSLELFNAIQDPWGRGIALRGLAGLAADRAEYASARAQYAEAVAAFRETHDVRGLAQALLGLGKAALRDGAVPEAREAFIEGLGYWQELGITAGVVRCIAGAAAVAAAEGQLLRAVRMHTAATRFIGSYGVVYGSADRAEWAAIKERLRTKVAAQEFEAESARGDTMTLEETIAEALT